MHVEITSLTLSICALGISILWSALIAIAILLVLLLFYLGAIEGAISWWKATRLIGKLTSIRNKVITDQGDGVSEQERKDFKDVVDSVLKQADGIKIDSKKFSEGSRKQIKDLLKSIEESAKSPNFPDDLRQAINKLIEIFKDF